MSRISELESKHERLLKSVNELMVKNKISIPNNRVLAVCEECECAFASRIADTTGYVEGNGLVYTQVRITDTTCSRCTPIVHARLQADENKAVQQGMLDAERSIRKKEFQRAEVIRIVNEEEKQQKAGE